MCAAATTPVRCISKTSAIISYVAPTSARTSPPSATAANNYWISSLCNTFTCEGSVRSSTTTRAYRALVKSTATTAAAANHKYVDASRSRSSYNKVIAGIEGVDLIITIRGDCPSCRNRKGRGKSNRAKDHAHVGNPMT
jgi:hypothetical protein